MYTRFGAMIFAVLILASLGIQNAFANSVFTDDCAVIFKDIFAAGDSICASGDADFTVPAGEIIPDVDIHIVPTGTITTVGDNINSQSLVFANSGPTGGGGAFFSIFISTANPPIPPGTYDIVIDEDEDGIFDSFDLVGNSFQVLSAQSESCFDGIDNDGDGLVDGLDLDCQNDNQVIGGKTIPIKTTSLLFAGTHLIASWLIPTSVTMAGISLILVRKWV